jgi:hypothetical protein
MIHVCTFIVVGMLAVAWGTRTGPDFCVKLVLIALAGWHLFIILQQSGYIIKV